MKVRISLEDLYKAVTDNFVLSFDQRNGVQLTPKSDKKSAIFYFCGHVEILDNAVDTLHCTYNPEDEAIGELDPNEELH